MRFDLRVASTLAAVSIEKERSRLVKEKKKQKQKQRGREVGRLSQLNIVRTLIQEVLFISKHVCGSYFIHFFYGHWDFKLDNHYDILLTFFWGGL